MAEQKIRLGKGKKRNERWFQATISESALRTMLEDHLQEYGGHKFVKVNINIAEQPDQYGKDVEITLDTWKPSYATQPQQVQAAPTNNEPQQSDLPF